MLTHIALHAPMRMVSDGLCMSTLMPCACGRLTWWRMQRVLRFCTPQVQPRPTFLGASLVIPKFDAADPRRALAISSAPLPLLSFGLVAGTAFSPPCAIYTSDALQLQLEASARSVLATTVELDASAGQLQIGLPVRYQ